MLCDCFRKSPEFGRFSLWICLNHKIIDIPERFSWIDLCFSVFGSDIRILEFLPYFWIKIRRILKCMYSIIDCIESALLSISPVTCIYCILCIPVLSEFRLYIRMVLERLCLYQHSFDDTILFSVC